MKNLFILISVLAASYLFAQTDFAKRLFTEYFSSSSIASIKQPTVDKASDEELTQALQSSNKSDFDEKENNGLHQALVKSETRQKSLEVKVAELEERLAELQNLTEQKSLTEYAKPNHGASSIENSTNATQSQASPEIKSASAPIVVSQTNTADEKPELTSNSHQKRLRQQAKLRQIAQKMELSALSALSQ